MPESRAEGESTDPPKPVKGSSRHFARDLSPPLCPRGHGDHGHLDDSGPEAAEQARSLADRGTGCQDVVDQDDPQSQKVIGSPAPPKGEPATGPLPSRLTRAGRSAAVRKGPNQRDRQRASKGDRDLACGIDTTVPHADRGGGHRHNHKVGACRRASAGDTLRRQASPQGLCRERIPAVLRGMNQLLPPFGQLTETDHTLVGKAKPLAGEACTPPLSTGNAESARMTPRGRVVGPHPIGPQAR
jgi:hypothetical protein